MADTEVKLHHLTAESPSTTLTVRRSTLQEILDIVDDPNESYPSQDAAQDFFEVNWDLFEELAALAAGLGMKPSHEGEEEEEGVDAPEED